MAEPENRFAADVQARLEKEQIIWLTTVGPDGTPHPRPVWFRWNAESFLIFSKPKTAKVRDISRNRRVALNLNSDEWGGDVQVFIGEAEILSERPARQEIDAYIAKYEEGIKDIGLTPEKMEAEYSVPIRVRPIRMYGQ